ncbi:C25 family cysteine peptidase [Anaerolineales bacterium HSG25]|nr:C25 family cysteine peptidase [Anaerolineales bacterium HSG25]
MRVKTLVVFVFTLLVLVSVYQPTSQVVAQEPSGSGMELLSSSNKAIVVELTVDGFQVETIEHDGDMYQRLIISEMEQMGQAGFPQLPTRGTLLGVPSMSGVSVEILEADYETLTGYHLYPAPEFNSAGEGRFVRNDDIYQTNAFYPNQLAKVGHTGYMRDQAVAQVQFYPVQYNPATQEVQLYQRIVVQVTWSESKAARTMAKPRTISPDYEALLANTLLNYESLNRAKATRRTPQGLVRTGIGAAQDTNTLKIGVVADGIQKISYDEIVNAGFTLNGTKRQNLQLTYQKTPIPIYIPGDGTDVFTATDYILFYGTAIDDLYTAENIYWLTVSDSNGLRMTQESGSPTGFAGSPPTQFSTSVHAETNSYPWYTPPDGETEDYWFWGDKISSGKSKDYSVTLNHLAPTTTTATVRIRLRGHAGDETVNPDHNSQIKLNGTVIDTQTWDGQITFTHEISSVTLKEGENEFNIEALKTEADSESFFLNWIEIDYIDTYVAENDELQFGAPSVDETRGFNVTSFSQNEVHVFDVTNPINPILITDPEIEDAGSGKYTLKFESYVKDENSRFLAVALTENSDKKPTLRLEKPSNLKDANNEADYIIITHQAFYTSATKLKEHRDDKFTVALVDVEDIYDEFNNGIFNPQAIRDFLTYAYTNWSQSPEYVVLVGDGRKDYQCWDSRGCKDLIGYVPSRLVQTQEGLMSSDNWFAQVSGNDLLPDMFIGRLSVETDAQGDAVVNKIISYEQNGPSNHNLLVIADNGKNPAEGNDFLATSDKIASIPPYNYTANTVYIPDYFNTDKNATTDISSYINNGSLFVNFTGHGGVNFWATYKNGKLFEAKDVEALTNSDLSIVTVANCLSGDFAVSSTDSMAEEFLRLEGKGAVAVWAPSGLGFPSGHRTMMSAFYEKVFRDDQYGLGQSVLEAEMYLYNNFSDETARNDLVQSYIFFGDPATQIAVTDNNPYVEKNTVFPKNNETNVPIDRTINFEFSKSMFTSTVQLSSEPTAVFTPTWSDNNTKVSYTHSDLPYGTKIQLTINGQDVSGNSVVGDCAPNNCAAPTWSFTTIQGTHTIISATEGGTITYTDGQELATVVDFPAGAVTTETMTFLYTNDDGQEDNPDYAGHGFELSDLNYVLDEDFRFSKPVMVTINYSDAEVAGMDENSLVLRYHPYSPNAGLDVADTCTPRSVYNRQPDENKLTIGICNVGLFSLSQTHAPESVSISGPMVGLVDSTYNFTATISSDSATIPINYEWQGTDHKSDSHEYSLNLTNKVEFFWSSHGTKVLTVTATGNGSTETPVMNTHTIIIGKPEANVGVDPEVDPQATSTLAYDGTVPTTVEIPALAVTYATTVTYATIDGPTDNSNFVQHAFMLMGFQNGAELNLQTFTFAQPINITINHGNINLARQSSTSLELRYYDTTSNSWQDAACRSLPTPPDADTLIVPVCKLGQFALFKVSTTSDPQQVYLPVVVK